MATLEVNSFHKYTLTEQEVISGSILSPYQRMVIQNLIADVAEEKLGLMFDPKNPENFMQQEADLAGKIAILRFILENSKAYEELAMQKAVEQSDAQGDFDSVE